MSYNRERVLRSVLAPCPDDWPDTGYHRLLTETRVPRTGKMELLIEPQRGISLELLRKSSIIDLLLAEEKSTYLENYLWLIVPRSRVENLRTDDHLVRQLVEQGVERIWPNLPLEAQAAAGSTQGVPLSTILTTIGATNLPLTKRAGEQVTWAIIDTDVRASHQVFQSVRPQIMRYHADPNGVVSSQVFDPTTTDNHGSHVAGIFHAVAPYASITSIALDCHQSRVDPDAPWIIDDTGHLEAALQWVSKQPAIQGVNLSLGINPVYQDSLVGRGPGCTGIESVIDKDKVVIVAAGNYGEDMGRCYEISITDPANAYGAFVVGACDSENPEKFGVCTFSSRGPTADGREKPDLVAPGVKIESCGHKNDLELSTKSGTSQAVPLVSGACALLLSQARSGVYPRDVMSCLVDPAAVRTMYRVRTYQGAGQLWIPGALQVAINRGYI